MGSLLGVSPEQQKLEIDAEIDRLVDGGYISYDEMSEVCLTIQTTKKQLLSAHTGLYCNYPRIMVMCMDLVCRAQN